MKGRVIAVNPQTSLVIYKVNNTYGVLEVLSFMSLEKDDIIYGDLSNTGNGSVMLNNEIQISVSIEDYDLSFEQAYEKVFD